jgi:two-component system CheB/CheR fusion protein
LNQEPVDPEFVALLDFLRQSRGFDFHSYKRASHARRIDRRMQAVKAASYSDYCD